MFPLYKSKLSVIPIGIEETVFLTSSNLARIPKNDHPVIMHIGGFSFEKNHERLLCIFKELLQVHPGATLHLIGNGPLKMNIQALANSMLLNESIKFYGARTDIHQLIRGVDVLVLPSIIEGLPGVILEAFYNRIPVVAYNVGGIKEVVQDYKTGRLINKNNESDFVGAILELLEDRVLRENVTENAYKLVTESYFNSQIAIRFLNQYECIVTQKKSTRAIG
jgi:glycosyltransferase involved in cell wall biosynthesis